MLIKRSLSSGCLKLSCYKHCTAKCCRKRAIFSTFSPITYHYEMTHLVVDKLFQLCFLQFALVTRVFVENLYNSDHATLQVRHILLGGLQQTV